MLWTLLTVTSSASFLAGALASAKHAKAGFGGYTLAIIIGLLLGVCNACTLSKLADTVAHRLERYSESTQEWGFRVLYLAASMWILFAALLGGWATSTAIRLLV